MSRIKNDASKRLKCRTVKKEVCQILHLVNAGAAKEFFRFTMHGVTGRRKKKAVTVVENRRSSQRK